MTLHYLVFDTVCVVYCVKIDGKNSGNSRGENLQNNQILKIYSSFTYEVGFDRFEHLKLLQNGIQNFLLPS